MTYDFDTVNDRRSEFSMKWDVNDGELPMWVADMDFKTAPEITEAIVKRAEHGIFGYTDVPARWKNAVISWYKKRHSLTIEYDSLMFSTGVVAAISSIVRKLTTPNENVVLLTPVYNIFFNSIINNGCRALECPLIYDGEKYEINWTDFEEKLSDKQTTLFILCNPHNPTGVIWDRETLAKIGALCKKYHVTVISDEIHCDISDPGYDYVPFASVNDECKYNSITCIAPTKTFNLAGLQTSAVYVPDEYLFHKVWRALNTDEVAEPNVFAMTASIAAYEHGEKWLDELREYLYLNKKAVRGFIEKEIPEINIVNSHATYLLWLDCSKICENTDALADDIRAKTGLYLSKGSAFGKGGEAFLRMNTACPKRTIDDGLGRLKTYFKLIK
ncbi:MAG: pyridoxal phosphate-dependent aminotransferase [Oscillospiraceae bacterium]|nr:pyridoxal phosphate-dependent aminotransferase [Oscillospiraceae bacterium]